MRGWGAMPLTAEERESRISYFPRLISEEGFRISPQSISLSVVPPSLCHLCGFIVDEICLTFRNDFTYFHICQECWEVVTTDI
jgi:hypothetical protein